MLSSVVLNGTVGDNQWLIRLNPNDISDVQFFAGDRRGRLLEEHPRNDVTSLTIEGGSGNNVLTVDCSNGVPLTSGVLKFDGTAGTQSLKLIGNNGVDVKFLPAAQNGSGNVTAAGVSLAYTGVQRLFADSFNTATLATPTGSTSLDVINQGGGIISMDGRSGATVLTPISVQHIRKLVIDTAATTPRGKTPQDVNVTLAGQPAPKSLKLVELDFGRGHNTITDGAMEATVKTHVARFGTLDAEVDFNSTLNPLGRQRFDRLYLQDTSTLRLAGGAGQVVRIGRLGRAPGTSQDRGRGTFIVNPKLLPASEIYGAPSIVDVNTFGPGDDDYAPAPWINVQWANPSFEVCYNRYLVQHVILTDPDTSPSNTGSGKGNDNYWEAWTISRDGTVGGGAEVDHMEPSDAAALCTGGNYTVEGWAYIYDDTDNQLSFPDHDPNAGGLPTSTTAPSGGTDSGAYHHGVFEDWEDEYDNVNFCY